MRILVINSLCIDEALGGAERSTHLTSVGFVELGHEVKIISFSKKRFFKKYKRDNIQIGLYPLPNIYWPFGTVVHAFWQRCLFHLLDLINPISLIFVIYEIVQFRPNIIWTNMLKGWSAAPWIAAKIFRVPAVSTMREFDTLYSGNDLMHNPNNPSKIPYIWLARRQLSKIPTAFVGISKDIRNRYLNEGYYPKVKSYVIHNPLSVNYFVDKDFTIKRDIVNVGWLGRFAGEKGINVFLEAARRLHGNSTFVFHVAGDGDPKIRDEVEKLAVEGVIKYWGYSKSFEFFDKMDISVVSSLAPEPFGRVVIEAFQSGCFVISSNRGGLPEVNSNHKCGIIYDGSIDELVSALRDSVDVLAGLCSEDFQTEVSKYYPDIIARSYIDVFDNLS